MTAADASQFDAAHDAFDAHGDRTPSHQGSVIPGKPLSGLVVRDTIIDPARVQELINAEFIPDGPFLVTSNERGCVGYRYDALPALAAAEPTAFGCIVCEDERHGGRSTLVAMLWDGVSTRIHNLSPVDVSTTTVANVGDATSIPGKEFTQ